MGRKGRSNRGRFPYFLQQHPETAYWLGAGLMPRTALALAQAGFLSLADLDRATSERLLDLPHVGPGTLERLEELLGAPLPGRRPRKETAPVFTEEVWRQRGLPMGAAVTFAQEGMTLARLSSMSRDELKALPFVGAKALAACEEILGRKIPSTRVHPVEAFWRSQGFSAAAARSLRKGGFASLEDFGPTVRREDVPVGDGILRRVEHLLGRPIPSRRSFWIEQGMNASMATRLCLAGLFHLDDVAPLSKEQFLARPLLGTYTLIRCERLLGRRLPSVGKYWLHRGASPGLAWRLALAGINNPEALAAATEEELRAAGLSEEEIAWCRQEAARRDGV
jgi:hypothetical protein